MVEVSLRDVSLFLQNRHAFSGNVEYEAQILHSVSATIPKGTVCAIIGSSGCGKTTLIDLICGRQGTLPVLDSVPSSSSSSSSPSSSSPARVTGSMTFDGLDPNPLIPIICAYVKQGDFLLPHLTAKETLQFAARLRLPSELTDQQRETRVDEVISELGLRECANTIIGSEFVRGLSGGEKRRVSIGVQLLTDPKLLVLDEPTTGLDSFTAHNLIEYLVKLARQGRTVICSIHQPRSDIFNMFDSVLLLSRGYPLYSGPVSGIIPHFTQLGLKCPPLTNPADFILDASTIDHRSDDSEKRSVEQVRKMVIGWKQRCSNRDQVEERRLASSSTSSFTTVSTAELAAKSKSFESHRPGFFQQTAVLTHRAVINLYRDKYTTLGLICESLILASALGAIFWKLPVSETGLRSRTSLTYMCANMQPYLLLIYTVFILDAELAVFDRERSDNMYHSMPWFFSRFISTFPVQVLVPVLFGTIVYFMTGLRTDESFHFWVFVGCQVLVQFVSTSMALMCSSIMRTFAQASLLANSIYTFLCLSSGYFLTAETQPSYIEWFRQISFVHWGFRLMATNEFNNQLYPCPITPLQYGNSTQAMAAAIAQCKKFDGNLILQSLSLPTDDYIRPTWALAVIIGVQFFVAALFLVFYSPSSIKSNPSAESLKRKKAIFADHELADRKDFAISVDNSSGPLADLNAVQNERWANQSNHDVADHLGSKPSVILQNPLFTSHSAISSNQLHFVPKLPPVKVVPWRLLKSSAAVKSSSSQTRNLASQASLNIIQHSSSTTEIQLASLHSSAEISIPGSSSCEQLLRKVIVDVHNVSVFVPVPGPSFLQRFQASCNHDESSSSSVVDKRCILDNVTAHMAPGNFWVILGGSGSGKSTLLNVLANRADSNNDTRGEVLFNGQPYSDSVSMSYVMQADYLIPTLTVRETLQYAARLRLPDSLSLDAKLARVEEVIAELGLKECADTRIGSDEHGSERGVSGGERRRTSIAVQLLSDPSVLLLDEPTSGLDSTSAHALMLTLKSLASDRGRTVIASIHQPRSDVFQLMDQILLLSRGKVVYSGPSVGMVEYFSKLGYPCPNSFNPADWVLDVSSIDLRNEVAEAESRTRVNQLAAAYKESHLFSSAHDMVAKARQLRSSQDKSEHKLQAESASFFKAFPILVSRSYTHLFRSPLLIVTRIMQVVSLALIFCIYFAPLKDGYTYVMNRLGLLQQLTAILFVGMLNCFAVFPFDRGIFYRERADGAYGSAPFVMSYLVGELPFEIASALLFALCMGPLCGLRSGGAEYFQLAYTSFLVMNTGESLGVLFCAFIQHVGFAVSLVNAALTCFVTMAGFMSLDLPGWLDGINRISALRYTAQINSIFEFRDLPISCNAKELVMYGGVCPLSSGNQVLSLYKFNRDDLTTNFIVASALVVAYRLAAFMALHFNRPKFAQ